MAVQDIRYAEKATATIPHRVQQKQLKILVTGQPETGRTTAVKNLFASIVQDPEWSPTDVSGLTMHDFRSNPKAFATTIENRPDTAGDLSITYIIQVCAPLQCASWLHMHLQPGSMHAMQSTRHASCTRALGRHSPPPWQSRALPSHGGAP